MVLAEKINANLFHDYIPGFIFYKYLNEDYQIKRIYNRSVETIDAISSYTSRDSAEISIFVDTTHQIRSIDFNHLQDSTFAFHAFPVYVTNVSNEYAAVGYGQYIDLILEAKDKDAKWTPIERGYKYRCGTSIEDIILAPSTQYLKVFTSQNLDLVKGMVILYQMNLKEI